MKEKVTAELKNSFRPEFLNRIDATVVFRSLTVDEIREIVDLMLQRVREQLKAQSMSLEVTQAAKDQLIKLGWDPAFGARPLRRAIQNQIEDVLAEHLLLGKYPAGTTIVVDAQRRRRPGHPGRGAEDPRRSLVGPAMARAQSRFVCQACGADFPRWEGQCRSCAAWNTLVETVVTARQRATAVPRPRARRRRRRRSPLSAPGRRPRRSACRPASRELDRVLGGGIVPGSLLLIGGEPGRRASRRCSSRSPAALRRGRAAACCTRPARSRPGQVRLRAARLGLGAGPAADAVAVLATSEVGAIVEAARARRPALVVVDSIQTMTVEELDGPAGSVGQVRESALRLMELAKGEGIAVVLVGHVTKDGSIAGPRTLEHLVDAVIELGGERGGVMRLLRASKNRFGSTDELGVFEMGESGLREVADPGRAFLAEHEGARAGQRRRGDDGGQPAAPRRGPGARLAGRLRHARAARLGHRPDPTRAAARGARPARRGRPRQPRRLRESRRRPDRRRAGPRPGRRPGPRLVAARPAGRSGHGRGRRGRACSASSARSPGSTGACARPPASASSGRSCPAGRLDGSDVAGIQVVPVANLRDALRAALVADRAPARRPPERSTRWRPRRLARQRRC